MRARTAALLARPCNGRLDEKDEIGLIWIDSHAPSDILKNTLSTLKSHLSPENVVLVGLREASADAAAFLKSSRITVFTMVEIDATGIREVMREAIRIASAGTKGIHVSYSPTVTEIPGSIEGSAASRCAKPIKRWKLSPPRAR